MKFFSNKKRYKDIDPDEIFLDSKNLPAFDIHQFEGRIEKPIAKSAFALLSVLFVVVGAVFMYKLYILQVTTGRTYKIMSENNRLDSTIIFADRGVIYDRNKQPLAWNEINPLNPDFPERKYATSSGLSAVLGYLSYPAKDNSGFYYQKTYVAKSGLEKQFQPTLSGVNGLKLTETNALGKITGGAIVQPPVPGEDLVLSIDEGVQKTLYQSMLDLSGKAGYRGGAGVIMDIQTGEILAMASFPEFDANTLTSGDDKDKITEYFSDRNNPFLNRVISGLYTPGSIVKPFVGMGVLDQGVISPTKQILSTGSISIPNPYNKDKPTIFKDWKAHGLVDFRRAIAVSSNVYFYEVSGGFGDQKGIGIANVEKYMRLFGLGDKTNIELAGEQAGVIPNPEWKKELFGGEPWRLGDTYNTAIGQYGVQVTPIQVVRAVSAIANDGTLLLPTFISNNVSNKTLYTPINLKQEYFDIVKQGMRMTVTEGTARSLDVPYVAVAAKTGTAELGVTKSAVNSWVIGFFPYEKPRYAFAIVMEKGRANNQVGAALVMRNVLEWMHLNRPDFLTN